MSDATLTISPPESVTTPRAEFNGHDPNRGRGRFHFCSQSTRPGRFTVRSRLTWDDGEYHEKWLAPRTIRLHR